MIESSYILTLNPAGQIVSMNHPQKGKVTFSYNEHGGIAQLHWKQQTLTLEQLQGMQKLNPQQNQIVEYLLVASRAIKSLKSL